MANHDELIAQYSSITGDTPSQSRQYLEAFDWNLELAIEDHYQRAQDSDHDPEYEDDEPVEAPAQSSGGGYRLGDSSSISNRPVPSAPPSTSKSKAKRATNKKFATLGDVGSSNPQDDSDSEEGQDMFAGGEKSGLAVQNPDDLKKKIIEKAAKHGKELDEPQKKSNFVGNARTLGGDDTPSREIAADPREQPVERVRRILHFWSDGFSVDEGELFRFDDARNAEMLRLIRSGRAPLHIMNVQPGQEVDVEVRPHEEAYTVPKQAYKPFGGSGTRLGAPTPGTGNNASSPMPGAFVTDIPAATPKPTAPAAPPSAQIDESKPVVTLRISLGTGTRLTSRFNTDQTIGDVYDFVRRAEPGGRSFVLQTTFPNKEFTDHSAVLGEIAEFKRGGAVVQKYT